MVLYGKMIREVEIKSDTDLFYSIFTHNPLEVCKATSRVHGCQLHEGSVISWTYYEVIDGNRKTAYEKVEREDKKKMITLTVIEGDLLEEFKSFVIKLQVKKEGKKKLVSWTLEYEKLHEAIEDPFILMAYFADITRDIEAYQLA